MKRKKTKTEQNNEQMNVFDVIYYNKKKLLNFRNDVITFTNFATRNLNLFYWFC